MLSLIQASRCTWTLNQVQGDDRKCGLDNLVAAVAAFTVAVQGRFLGAFVELADAFLDFGVLALEQRIALEVAVAVALLSMSGV